MKVYFAFSTLNLENNLQDYKKIVDTIRKLGHEITIDLISKAVTAKDTKVRLNSADKFEEFRKEAIGGIDDADLLIVEVSIPSSGAGLQIGYALTKRKPVLALYSPKLDKHSRPKIIQAMQSDLLRVKKYDKGSLKKILVDFFSNFPEQNLIKFNFIITREIESYLNWLQAQSGNSKSQVLRKKVIEVIDTDKEYKSYLQRSTKSKYIS